MVNEYKPNKDTEHIPVFPKNFIENRDTLLLAVSHFASNIEIRIKNKDIFLKTDLDAISRQLEHLKKSYMDLKIEPRPNMRVEDINIPELLFDKDKEILNTGEFQIKLSYAVTSGNFGMAEACLKTAQEKIEIAEKTDLK